MSRSTPSRSELEAEFNAFLDQHQIPRPETNILVEGYEATRARLAHRPLTTGRGRSPSTPQPNSSTTPPPPTPTHPHHPPTPPLSTPFSPHRPRSKHPGHHGATDPPRPPPPSERSSQSAVHPVPSELEAEFNAFLDQHQIPRPETNILVEGYEADFARGWRTARVTSRSLAEPATLADELLSSITA